MADCDKLLQDGLYSFTRMTNTGSFTQDLRTYFLSNSFKADMKSGKWGTTLTIPIEGVPISLGMDENDEKFNEFREKILRIQELHISEQFYQTAFSTLPNTNLYNAYVKCVEITKNDGLSGFVQGLNVETEDAVVFTIYFKPSSPTDPLPTVNNFHVEPADSVISGGLKIGQQLTGFTRLVTCKRDPEKDLLLTLETDRGAITSKASAADTVLSNKDVPVGTVITSFLTFEQFNVASNNNEKSPGGIWTSQKSKWSPCDGRQVPGSKFSKITSRNDIPDLRGMFLRGLNTFDPNAQVGPVLNGDPENRSVGEKQEDAVRKHHHTAISKQVIAIDSQFKGENRLTVVSNDEDVTGDFGDNETRPKNISVFYYVKIN